MKSIAVIAGIVLGAAGGVVATWQGAGPDVRQASAQSAKQSVQARNLNAMETDQQWFDERTIPGGYVWRIDHLTGQYVQADEFGRIPTGRAPARNARNGAYLDN